MTNPALVALSDSLPKFDFTVPASAREWKGDPQVITIRQLTLAEEQQALKSADGDANRFVTEAVKHCLVEADGQKITWADGGKERFFEGCSPKVRAFLRKAYVNTNTPSDEEENAFLASKTVRV